jgi:hypothetical protein
LYQLTLSNTGTTGGTLFDLFVSVPIDISDLNTATIGAPMGWGDPAGGLLFFGPDGSPSTSFIEWTADFSGADDVAVGRSLAGFSFTTLQPINGQIRFALNDATNFDTAVQGPTAPEPATLPMLLFAGLAVSVGGLWGRRRLRGGINRNEGTLREAFVQIVTAGGPLRWPFTRRPLRTEFYAGYVP